MRAALLCLGLTLAGCATADTFRLSPAEQVKAEEAANTSDMARTAAQGLEGTWLTADWRGAVCRWSRSDPALAVCRTASRRDAGQAWKPSVVRYRRDNTGGWVLQP